MPLNIVIPEAVAESGVQFLTDRGYHVEIGKNPSEPDEVVRLLKSADGALSRGTRFTAEVLSQLPNLKIIARHGVGTDMIDLDYCREHGIWVTITPDSNSNAVAEHTIGLILAAAHHIVASDAAVKSGNWQYRNTTKGQDVKGKTLGVLGMGRIGRLVAQKASLGLGMSVIGFDTFVPTEKFPANIVPAASMEELVEKSDFLSLHIPATKETANLIDLSLLKRMKPTATLVNCARGELVNEADLYTALKEKIIAFAALDVMVQEPCISSPLFSLDNIIVTPHNAVLTYETMDSMSLQAACEIDRVLSGKDPSWAVVKGYRT